MHHAPAPSPASDDLPVPLPWLRFREERSSRRLGAAQRPAVPADLLLLGLRWTCQGPR